MADKKFTFFEFHFDGPLRIGPSFGEDPTPDVEATDGGDTDAEPDVPATAATDDDVDAGGGAPVKGAFLGLLLIVALAVAARVLLGDDDADVDDVEMVGIDDDVEDFDTDA